MKENTSRLSRKLRRLNIAVVRGFDLNMPLIAPAAMVCETCPRSDRCETWLRAGIQDHGYRAFWPNAARLDCLPRSASVIRSDRVA